jgi:uncharacterized protein (TIGR01777 family)
MRSRIILAGGNGFLGSLLRDHFCALGWEVVLLTRRPLHRTDGAREVLWDGETLGPWAEELDGATAVVNLCGKTVNCRYTPSNRRLLIDSRVKPTRVLGAAIARCSKPPLVWLNASSATLYKHTFGPAHDETGETGPTHEAKDAFSIEIIRQWEDAFFEQPTPHTRKVALRTAMVLGHGSNSVFPVLRRLTRWGLGGRMGSGRQYVSWIHAYDFCSAILWLIKADAVSGPINLAAPCPLTNAEMMRQFRAACGRPFGLPAEEWMLEVGAFILRTETELIIKSRRVVPGRLAASGFTFRFPDFANALADLMAQDN